MRKQLLLLTCIGLMAFNSFSQCIPDTSITHNVPGIYPDSATGLPHAQPGQPYSTVIQLKVILDTVYLGIPATVDSVVITSVTGMPVGFTYTCTPSSCHFPGGSDACITLQNPLVDLAYAGQVYPLIVHVTAYGHAGIIPASLPQDINRYRITVDPATGIAGLSPVRFDVSQNVPNPFSKTTEISFSTPVNDFITFKVSNLLGKTLYTKTIYATRGINKITLPGKDFDAGIYIYTISNARSSVTKRMIVSGE